MLKHHTRFPITWRICYNIVLEVGIPKVIVLEVIPYSFSIRDFMNSWTMTSNPWSYVISIGIGYLVNHIVSIKFLIDIALLLSYCVILNHPATGFIMVTDFSFNFSFCTFLIMKYGTIIYTEFVPWYFLIFLRLKFTIMYIWPFCTLSSVTINYFLLEDIYNWGSVKMLEIIASVPSIPGWRINVWYQCNT